MKTTTTTILLVLLLIMMMIMLVMGTKKKMMIMIIALKAANRDFYNLLTAPQTVSITYAQVTRAQSCANHVQHIERLWRATCRVPRGTKGQLNYCVWQCWNRNYFSFISLAETINQWRRGGNRSTRRKPVTTSFRNSVSGFKKKSYPPFPAIYPEFNHYSHEIVVLRK